MSPLANVSFSPGAVFEAVVQGEWDRLIRAKNGHTPPMLRLVIEDVGRAVASEASKVMSEAAVRENRIFSETLWSSLVFGCSCFKAWRFLGLSFLLSFLSFQRFDTNKKGSRKC